MKNLLFIYNPCSGKSTTKTHMAEIIEIYSKAGYMSTVYASQYQGHISKLITQYAPAFEMLVVSGGDGTLNEAVGALMSIPAQERPRFSYIPAGSTNDYAKSLGIPRAIGKAAKRTVEGNEVVADVGILNQKMFVYVACFGILTEVTYETPQDIKNLLGRQAYMLEIAKRLATIKPYHARISFTTTDSEGNRIDKLVQGDFLLGMITNSRSVGGFRNITGKNVRINDGLFELTLIRVPKTPMDYNDTIRALLLSHTCDSVIRAKVSSVQIASEQELHWGVDGERAGDFRTAEVEVIPRAFRIMV